ncbi:MAG: MFS transporter [Deltaproteobacteria bacterium]|nr:MFS transporter [Deltaproteobacteria bacterium]
MENSGMAAPEKKGFFYGWIVALGATAMFMTCFGLGNSPGSLYIKPVAEDLGLDRGLFSNVFSVWCLGIMVGGSFMGALVKKAGLRTTLILGAVLCGGGFFLYSRCNSLIMFYAASAIFGVGCAFTTTVPAATLINSWFAKKQGLILGVVMASSGAAGAVFTPVVQNWINTIGWRSSYLYTGIIIFAVCMAGIAAIREKPEDMGLRPYGFDEAENNTAAKSEASRAAVTGLTLREAKGKPSFWLMLLLSITLSFAVLPLSVNAAASLSDNGLPDATVARLLSIVWAVLVVTKIMWGWVNDKLGAAWVYSLITILTCLSALLALNAVNAAAGVAFAIIFAGAFPATTMLWPLVAKSFFGNKDYSGIFGIVFAAMQVGFVGGIFVVGQMYDYYGNYKNAFLLCLAVGAFSAVAGMVMFRLRKAGH